MNRKTGTLFIVATPIGNLADITRRAVETLAQADLILAEDTRRAAILLRHLELRIPVQSFHQHNEAARLPAVLRRLGDGARIALISDAGTPLINDPGHTLVQRARREGIPVTPLPGANAAIAALSAAGQPAARFCLEGFLPAKAEARKQRLRALRDEPRTLVFHESSHRIAATLAAMNAEFGAGRMVTVAREITKKFETFYCGALAEVQATIAADGNECHRKGEFVIVLRGAEPSPADPSSPAPAEEIMALLLTEMPLNRASQIAARILGQNRNALYALGLGMKDQV